MFVKLSRWLLVLALCFSIGMQWEVLQSVAWLGMVVNYSQGATLKEGISKTFDGQHPCCLCKLVSEGKKAENKPEAQLKINKHDLFINSQKITAFFSPLEYEISPSATSCSSHADSPLTPPPRPV